MTLCLDTNAVIAMTGRQAPQVRERLELALADRQEVGIPSIVLYELRYGIAKSARRAENERKLTAFLTLKVTPWAFDAEDAEEAGDIRATLERAGTPIGPYDVLIAAQARRRNATLITANHGEFTRVPGLALADWS